VALRLHDALGRSVATLFEGRDEHGSRAVRFDTSPFPPGVYLLQLTSSAGVRVRSLCILR
jgi:hypothetical protein